MGNLLSDKANISGKNLRDSSAATAGAANIPRDSAPADASVEPNRAFVIGSWVAVAVVAVFIFAMSARDGYQIDYGSGIFSQVKQWLAAQALALTGHEVDVSPVGHFCEYLVFGVVLTNALRFHLKPQGAAGALITLHPVNALSKWAPAVACGLASVYGITDEFHQIFTPGRSCDPMDWLVDTIAAGIGALACYFVLKAWRARRVRKEQATA